MTHPCAQITAHADALAIVTDPARYAHHPGLRRFAWHTLLTARGRTMNQTRIQQMQRDGSVHARAKLPETEINALIAAIWGDTEEAPAATA